MASFGDCRALRLLIRLLTLDAIMSECPRITYQTPVRAFDRLFKGTNFPVRAVLARADGFHL
jgi:hypothetical protein